MATATNTATTARTRIARAAIVLGLAGAGAVLLPGTIAAALAGSNPRLAAQIAPGDARAAAGAAAAIGSDPRSPQSRALVRRILSRDLTQLSALELRAVDFAASGRKAEAEKLFALSDRLSRRRLPTRLWLIQAAVDHGDVAGALANFDTALRTSTKAPPILFPVLARASADPGLTVPLARALDRPSDWRLTFLEWALAGDVDFNAIADVVIAMRDSRLVRENTVDQRLIERLVTASDFAQALRVKRRFDRRPPPLLADPRFADPSARYPFGWGLVGDGSLGAERALGADGSTLTYHATGMSSGQVAAQLLVLRPGRYVLATRSAAPLVGEPPYWSLVCAHSRGAQLARLEQPAAAGEARAALAVPANCTAQWLVLRVRAGSSSAPRSGSIAWVNVTPG